MGRWGRAKDTWCMVGVWSGRGAALRSVQHWVHLPLMMHSTKTDTYMTAVWRGRHDSRGDIRLRRAAVCLHPSPWITAVWLQCCWRDVSGPAVVSSCCTRSHADRWACLLTRPQRSAALFLAPAFNHFNRPTRAYRSHALSLPLSLSSPQSLCFSLFLPLYINFPGEIFLTWSVHTFTTPLSRCPDIWAAELWKCRHTRTHARRSARSHTHPGKMYTCLLQVWVMWVVKMWNFSGSAAQRIHVSHRHRHTPKDLPQPKQYAVTLVQL